MLIVLGDYHNSPFVKKLNDSVVGDVVNRQFGTWKLVSGSIEELLAIKNIGAEIADYFSANSPHERNGIFPLDNIGIRENPDFFISFAQELKSYGINIYEDRQGICSTVIRQSDLDQSVTYQGLSAVRKYSIPDLYETMITEHTRKDTVILVSGKSIASWRPEELDALKSEYPIRLFIDTKRFGHDKDIQPTTSSRTIRRISETVTNNILRHPWIDTDRSCFVLNPTENEALILGLSIGLLNGCANILVPQRDENGMFEGYRELDTNRHENEVHRSDFER